MRRILRCGTKRPLGSVVFCALYLGARLGVDLGALAVAVWCSAVELLAVQQCKLVSRQLALHSAGPFVVLWSVINSIKDQLNEIQWNQSGFGI